MATLIKIDKNGSKHIEVVVPCDRCGGQGGAEQWKYTGWKCYKCGGSGKMTKIIIERTPEYQAKLDARREREAAKRQAEYEAKRAEIEAENARREKERAERKAAEEARKAVSQYIGTEGEKITVEALLEVVIRYEVPGPFGQPEYKRLYKFVDDQGNVVVWHTKAARQIAEGDKVTLTGTVKKHDEYKGEKQTVLIRCKW